MLFTAVATFNGVDGARIVAQQFPASPAKTVVEGAYYGRYVRSGHLLYIQGDTLFAAPFDVERLETSGAPVAVVQGVRTLTESASSWFDVSENGTLVYVPGALTDNDAPMVWLNRDGALKRLRAMPADWRNPQFSPDGQRLAFAVEERGQSDVWVHELESGREWNLTLDPAQDTSPIWSPDGSTIAFASSRGDGQTLNLYWQAADGTGGAQRLTPSPVAQRPTSWHRSGKYLAYHAEGEIAILPVENTQTGVKAGDSDALPSEEGRRHVCRRERHVLPRRPVACLPIAGGWPDGSLCASVSGSWRWTVADIHFRRSNSHVVATTARAVLPVPGQSTNGCQNAFKGLHFEQTRRSSGRANQFTHGQATAGSICTLTTSGSWSMLRTPPKLRPVGRSSPGQQPL